MIKATIQPDFMPLNKVKLSVPTLPVLTLISISGLEEDLAKVTLPDKTIQSGGRVEPVEFEIEIPLHHTTEVAAMEVWYATCQEPVLPGHKKVGTVSFFSQSNLVQRTYMLPGLMICGRGLPDGSLDNDGEQANNKWKMACDEILWIA